MADLPIVDPRFKSDLIFNAVSKQFITLKDEEMRTYNVHLRRVLDTFIGHMKRDPMFKACYRRIAYVGSYYEGLKVGKPEEFDLNVIINLPINYSCLTTIVASEKSGYVKLKADPEVLPTLRKHVRWSEYNGGFNCQPGSGVASERRYYLRTRINNSAAKSRAASQRRRRFRKKIMNTWFDEKSHLNQNKFRQWFESVVTKALGSFDNVGGKYVVMADGIEYLLHHKKSGPAWTLKIDVHGGHTVDVDLVPALEFATPPPKPFTNRNTTKQNWFTISKPLEDKLTNNQILWRPSFYERESDILKGSLKQVIRQMKKLRDTQNFKSIASYYIKTLFLWELEKQTPDFQKLPSTFLFYYMLEKLQEACAKGKIVDFWNPQNNLLCSIGSQTLVDISCRLSNIIKAIDKRIATDQYVIAEFILETIGIVTSAMASTKPFMSNTVYPVLVTKDELLQLKLSMTTSAMASTTLTSNNPPVVQQPVQNGGFLSGMWNAFWGADNVAPQ